MENEILINILNGKASEDEKALFEEWLNSSEKNIAEYEEIKIIWGITEQNALPEPPDVNKAWDGLKQKINRPQYPSLASAHPMPRKRKVDVGAWFVRIAAVFVIGVFLHLWLNKEPQIIEQPETAQETIPQNKIYNRITAKGEKAVIPLGDGTIVQLNSGSRLTYPRFFEDDERMVKLRGEAYFSVASDPERPFRVKVKDNIIEVVGTEFNIRNRKGDNFDLVVVSGKVKTYGKNYQKPIELIRGQMVNYDSHKGFSLPKDVDLEKFLAWKQNKLAFENTPLSEVVKEIEYFYNVRSDIKDKSLVDRKLTGVFNTDSIDGVLRAISLSLDINMERKGNTIIIE